MRTHTSAKLPAVAGVGCVGNTSHRAALRPCVQHRIPSHRQNLSLSYPLPCRTMSTSAASTAAAPSAQAAARSDLQQGSASMQVAIQELQQLCQDALKTLGYDDQQALTISEVSSCACSAYQAQMPAYTCHCSCFAGAAICAIAQQQQQHGQSRHWRSGQAVR